MNPFLMTLLIVIGVIALLATLAMNLSPSLRLRGRRGFFGQRLVAANIGEGIHDEGIITLRADAVIGSRYLLGKAGTDSDHIDLCGVGDIPKGIIEDEAAAIEDPVKVALLGACEGTRRGVASGAIAADDMLVAGALGTVRTLPVANGTYYIIGRAVRAAADGEKVEFSPSFPVQRVV